MRKRYTIILIFCICRLSAQTTGSTIEGNLDGSGKPFKAMSMLVTREIGNPANGGRAATYQVTFSKPNIPAINSGCCYQILINEGDLLGNGKDCLSVYSAPVNGCTYTLTTYCFIDAKWKVIMEPFLVPSVNCVGLGGDEIQKLVYKTTEGKIMYTLTDNAGNQLLKEAKLK